MYVTYFCWCLIKIGVHDWQKCATVSRIYEFFKNYFLKNESSYSHLTPRRERHICCTVPFLLTYSLHVYYYCTASAMLSMYCPVSPDVVCMYTITVQLALCCLCTIPFLLTYSLHVYYYCTASAMLSVLYFTVYCPSSVTVIVPGYICCIKRAGSTLLLVVQTGQYDWIPCTLYSTCSTGWDHATFRAVCAVKSYDFTWTVPMIWNLFSLFFSIRGPPLSPAQGSWRNRFKNN